MSSRTLPQFVEPPGPSLRAGRQHHRHLHAALKGAGEGVENLEVVAAKERQEQPAIAPSVDRGARPAPARPGRRRSGRRGDGPGRVGARGIGSRLPLGQFPDHRLDAGGPVPDQRLAHVVEGDVRVERGVVLNQGLVALRNLPGLEDHAVAGEHALDVARRELAPGGLQSPPSSPSAFAPRPARGRRATRTGTRCPSPPARTLRARSPCRGP